MLRFCGGWKGWSSEQALSEDLNYILAAKDGHIEMLQMVFGKPEDLPPDPERPNEQPITPTITLSDGKPFMMPQEKAPAISADIFDKLFGDTKGNG